MITLTAFQYENKLFTVDGYLTARNRVLSEADDILFLVKARQVDTDVNAVCIKSLSNGGIELINDRQLIVKFTPHDFGEGMLQSGEKYVYGLGFKYSDLDVYLEPRIINKDGNVANYLIVEHNYINQH